METNENAIKQINSLIEINNDRIEGYEKAMNETEDADLKELFSKLADDSRIHRSELTSTVINQGGSPAEGTTAPGKLYRVWMDIKSALTQKDRHAVLSSCEFGEDAALKAYQEVLDSSSLTSDLQLLIRNQHAKLKSTHDKIKLMRDSTVSH